MGPTPVYTEINSLAFYDEYISYYLGLQLLLSTKGYKQ